MPEMSCGKSNRCMHGEDCPYRKRPMVSYLCFESKPLRKAIKKQVDARERRILNDGRRS